MSIENKDQGMFIKCEECGAMVPIIQTHLKEKHPGMTVEQYRAKHPNAPLLSKQAQEIFDRKAEERQRKAAAAAAPSQETSIAFEKGGGAGAGADFVEEKRFLHEVFGLGKIPAAMTGSGKPIPISAFIDVPHKDMIPKVDEGYVFNVEELKSMALALTFKFNVYLYGHKGCGKTEFAEQVAARLGRPLVRVQHTVNTEESHIVGQWIVRNGNTEFMLGPLPTAMLNGWTYLADEYDFANPHVLSTYQAVLEGKPLYIKEAPPELRLIVPRKEFAFWATGNTNGSGDESGLYLGTNVQNKANYDRFHVLFNKDYMPAEAEKRILVNRTKVDPGDAAKLVEFAVRVRKAFADREISDVISTRALISATMIGLGTASFLKGLQMAFINKLSEVDAKVVSDIAQRVIGGKA